MRLALVLGGGGTRGLAHIGIIKFLEELNIKIDVISGCSMGAIIGALYSSTLDLKKVEEISLNINLHRMIDFTLSKQGFIHGKKFVDYLKSKVKVLHFKELKIPLYVNAFSITKGREIIFRRGDLWDAVRSSMSVPGVFVPINKNNNTIIDGGVFNNIPFSIIPKKEYDKIILVNVNKPMPSKRINSLNLIFLSIQYMQNSIFLNQLKNLDNDYILLEPKTGNLNFLDLNSSHYKKIINLGYEEARRNKNKLIKYLNLNI